MRRSEIDLVVEALEAELRPYRDSHPTHRRLPAEGRDRAEILAEMRELAALEEPTWRGGLASGAVYHGGKEHIDFLNEVYAVNSQADPLHPELWPSVVKYESEIVAMTASMLGGGQGGVESVCGTVSSGGTESILLAMRAYRDRAAERRRITEPEILAPVSAHAAFDKAARSFGMRLVPIPLGADWRADAEAAAKLVTQETVVIVGSAPGYPHGVIDPIDELASLARSRGVGFHVDACMGGFVLPWAEKLGYHVPPFDFRLPGVTSISVDAHQFGFSAKGSSVILYRDRDLREYQYYRSVTWMGGLYYSPTFAGSRPGAISAQTWAAMVSFGEQGYMVATKAILETAALIRRGIEAIGDLYVLGDPLWVIAFASDTIDVYAVVDQMSNRGWNLNGLQAPAAAHLCVTLRHAQPGIAQKFIADLQDSVEEVRHDPKARGSMAPIYGMAGSPRTRGTVDELLVRYGDVQFKA